jgi:hypothetical protein
VKPTDGTFAETFTVSGSGFAANEIIHLWFTPPAQNTIDYIDVRTDANGVLHPRTFVINRNAPRNKQPGTWRITGQGNQSAREGITEFKVSPGEAPAQIAELTVDPQSPTFATKITVSGRNFVANERVSLWMNPPGGEETPISTDASADEDGKLLPFTFTIKDIAPPNLAGGKWVITGQGHQSRRSGTIEVQVTP